MGGRGIEKLRGFEPYVSLTSLWLNNNKLKKINNLEANFRIKALYAQVSCMIYIYVCSCVLIQLCVSASLHLSSVSILCLSLPQTHAHKYDPRTHTTGEPDLHAERQPADLQVPRNPRPVEQSAAGPGQNGEDLPVQAQVPEEPEPHGAFVLFESVLFACLCTRVCVSIACFSRHFACHSIKDINNTFMRRTTPAARSLTTG